ncbi:MAG: hypothetical protein ABJA67_03510 [Chthonomonadales bacterium]
MKNGSCDYRITHLNCLHVGCEGGPNFLGKREGVRRINRLFSGRVFELESGRSSVLKCPQFDAQNLQGVARIKNESLSMVAVLTKPTHRLW